MDGVLTKIDSDLTREKGSAKYPFILIEEFGDELDCVLQSLEEGNVPIVVKHQGKMLQVFSASSSFLNLAKLLRVFKFSVYMSPDVNYKINNNIELVDLGVL